MVPLEQSGQIFGELSGEDRSMRELVLHIARALVEDQNSVDVELYEADGITTLKLLVAPADTGKVIGKQGHTARSFRGIITAAGMRFQKRYTLLIYEPQRHGA